jgi:metal-responsive CopG/Arc/MetJ family transcriptional regulator
MNLIRIMISLPRELIEKIDRMTEQEGLTRSGIIRRLLMLHFKKGE